MPWEVLYPMEQEVLPPTLTEVTMKPMGNVRNFRPEPTVAGEMPQGVVTWYPSWLTLFCPHPPPPKH